MSELQHTLRELQRELVAARRLDPDDRRMLEAALDDIRTKLDQPAFTTEDERAAAPGEALDATAVRLEANHPGLAGALRALVDALAKAGI
jgi:hypothetical protein